MMDFQKRFAAIDRRAEWLELAEKLTPELHRWEMRPLAQVECVRDSAAFQGVRMRGIAPFAGLEHRALAAGECVIADFGETAVGRIRLGLAAEGPNDAPVRLRITAAELPYEAAADFSGYRGTLSRAWLQDEVVTLDWLPGEFRLPRRFSLRYLKIEVLCVNSALRIRDIVLEAESAAGRELPPGPAPDGLLRAIDETGIRTLRNCMQTVLEDGPKRDRRLWLGDLRLEAAVNAVSFRRPDVVERSLYLLAGCSGDEGRCPGAVYERPVPRCGNHVVDYALLLAPVLLDHWNWYGRSEPARRLYPLACHQYELERGNFGADGLYVPQPGHWVFIDHQPALDRSMPLQAVCICSLRALAELGRRLGDAAGAARFDADAEHLRRAARAAVLDPETMLVHSGPERQVSVASQVWMIIAGVLTPEEGRRSLASLELRKDAVPPVTPYLYSHLLEAYRICGESARLNALIRDYWGGMVERGADTFWEVYVPGDDLRSPYGDALVNSACHAWSCTSSCYLREAAAQEK